MIDSVKFTAILKDMTGKKVQYNEGKLQYVINDGFASVVEGGEFVHLKVAADVGNHDGWTLDTDPFTHSVTSTKHALIKDPKGLMDDLKILSRACRST